jgi:hypothetical protein
MTPYRSLIEAAAQARNLDPNLVEGLILQESSGNTFSWNPEPRYRYLWNVATHQPFRPLTFAERASEEPPTDFPFLKGDRDQEWWAQQASWGLCQVMGATAREEGFRGPYLTQLCDPETNLTIGCSVLAKLLLWSAGNVHLALAAYNAGIGGASSEAGQRYATSVLVFYRSVELAHPAFERIDNLV